MSHHLPAILLVLAAAALAPVIGEATRRLGISVVVIEILLGVAIGPQGLGWADANDRSLPHLARFGMGFLFFMAGVEIDLGAIRDELKRASVAWALAFLVAAGAAMCLRAAGLVEAWPVVSIALATTALGVLVPILKDAAVLDTPFGRRVVAAGVMGELGPIVAMSMALSTRYTTAVQSLFTALFLALVALVFWASTHVLRPGVLAFLRRTMLRSGQLPVRVAVLLLVTLAVLAEEFGVDMALGAIAAGMIVGLAMHGAPDQTMHRKLEAIAFGFLVPVFFVASGMKLDVASVVATARGMALLGASFLALLAVRIPAVLVYRRAAGTRPSVAVALCSATTLSLIVAITGIAVSGGFMKPAEAAPLVGAGMLTVLLLPAVALPLAGLDRERGAQRTHDDSDAL